jgi:hypothetical protein
VIDLLLLDLSRRLTVSVVMPLVVDSGTDVTIIPRKLLPPATFPRERAVWPFYVPVTGLTGRTTMGLTFSATLAIVPREAGFGALSIGLLNVVVVDDDAWLGEFGMLGLDALRRVVVISDPKHISFWPLGISPAPSSAGLTDPSV